MNKKNILITGGNSPVAIDIAKNFDFIKCDVTVSTRKIVKKRYRINEVKYIQIDLKRKIKLKKKFDYLIHIASATPYKKYKTSDYHKINILGFRSLLKSIKNLRKIILISTTDVLELKSKSGLNKLKKDKKLIYSKSKYHMEKILKNFALKNKVRSLVLRCPAIMCKTPNDVNFIQKIVHNFHKEKNITIFNPKIKFNNIIDTLTLYKLINYFIKKNLLKKYFYVFSLAPRDNMRLSNFFKKLNKIKKLKINFKYGVDNGKITKPIKVSKKIFGNFYMPMIKNIIRKI